MIAGSSAIVDVSVVGTTGGGGTSCQHPASSKTTSARIDLPF
jgi:hypothetical protein